MTVSRSPRASNIYYDKTSLAPINTLTNPRVELNAAVIGVKLFNLIIRKIELPIEKLKFWLDSVLTLQCIQEFRVNVTDLKFMWQTKYDELNCFCGMVDR